MTESNVKSSMETVLDGVKAEKIKVLHVDDEQGFLKIAKQCLELQGPFHVDTTGSVEEAMEKMKKETYDVVVSDYMMPGKDGLQFLEELRQKGNNIPFIIFTGKGREEIVIKALNQGADHYENKEGDPETVYSELSHDIINIVKARRAEQELRTQREELQVVLDSMPAKIWYKDRNNRLVRVNKAFAEYMGVSKENLEGKPLCDLFPPDVAQKCWEEDKEVFTTGQPKTDILDRHESAQGVRWFSTGKVPCREKDGNIIGTINFSVDITERKKTEESLRESEEKFRAIFESATDVMVLLDITGRILDVNKKAIEVYGGSKEELIGKHFTRVCVGIVSPAIIPKVVKAFAEGLAYKTPRLNVTIKNKKGQKIPLECSNSLLKLGNKSVGLLIIGRDVAERKRAEEELVRNERKYRILVEQSLQGIVVAQGPAPHLVFANAAISTILDYTPEELTSLSPQETTGLIHPEDRDVFFGRFKDRLEGKPALSHYEVRGIRKDGTVVWLELSSTRIEYNGHPAVQATFIDVTERKKAEEALRKSEGRWRSLAEGSPDHIMLLDLMGNILYINRTVPDLKREEVIGTSQFNYVPPEWHRAVKDCFKRVIETGKADHYDTEYRTRDGEVRYFDVRIGPVFQEDRVVALISSSTDVTWRKKAEKEIENLARFPSENPSPILRIAKDGVILYANAAAKSMLGELKIEIGQPAPHKWRRLVSDALDSGLRKEVEVENEDRMFLFMLTPVEHAAYINVYGIDITERNRSLKSLRILNEKLGVVGKLSRHDVRNKLSAVVGNTYLTKKTLPNDHKALVYLKEIELACRQTTRVLDFAAAYESLGVEGLTLMDVDKAVEEAVSLISELKGVKVVNNCQGLTVMADSALRQLFFNLIENSLKHGKHVSQIKIHYEERKDRLKLFYEDNGVGIPKTSKPKLFAGGFTTGKGSGYGLSLIKSMMEIYGWTIEEEGKPRKGAKFVMTIPKTHITMRARRIYP